MSSALVSVSGLVLVPLLVKLSCHRSVRTSVGTECRLCCLWPFVAKSFFARISPKREFLYPLSLHSHQLISLYSFSPSASDIIHSRPLSSLLRFKLSIALSELAQQSEADTVLQSAQPLTPTEEEMRWVMGYGVLYWYQDLYF